MKSKTKPIRPDKVSMWINLLGFLVSILFYIRLEQKDKRITVVTENPLKDSALIINTQLQLKIKQLGQTHDSLIQQIQKGKTLLIQNKQTVKSVFKYLQQQFNSDWQTLTKEQQDAYIQKISTNPKK